MHGHLTAAAANLGAIAESDEDEEDEGGEAVEKGTTEQVPQAFSHFTYEVTEGKKLVCDLQVSEPFALIEFMTPDSHKWPCVCLRLIPTIMCCWSHIHIYYAAGIPGFLVVERAVQLCASRLHPTNPTLTTWQGVWNQVDGFTMTDPVIHHISSSKMYGKTDKGKAGIREFFATHKCNPICRQLGLDPSPRV